MGGNDEVGHSMMGRRPPVEVAATTSTPSNALPPRRDFSLGMSAMGVHTKPKGNSQEFSSPGPGGHLDDEKLGPWEVRSRRAMELLPFGEGLGDLGVSSGAVGADELDPKNQDIIIIIITVLGGRNASQLSNYR